MHLVWKESLCWQNKYVYSVLTSGVKNSCHCLMQVVKSIPCSSRAQVGRKIRSVIWRRCRDINWKGGLTDLHSFTSTLKCKGELVKIFEWWIGNSYTNAWIYKLLSITAPTYSIIPNKWICLVLEYVTAKPRFWNLSRVREEGRIPRDSYFWLL